MRRFLPFVAVAVLASVLTSVAIVLPAGAGDRDGDGRSPERAPLPGELRDRLERWESCMREQGIEVGPEMTILVTPDGVEVNGEPVDRDQFREARRECGRPFPGGGLLERFGGRLEGPDGRPLPSPERLKQCLNENAADV